jgi:hypothetical protein
VGLWRAESILSLIAKLPTSFCGSPQLAVAIVDFLQQILLNLVDAHYTSLCTLCAAVYQLNDWL